MPSGRRRSKKHKSKTEDKEFLELGRRHFAEDFPNPSRLGCPNDDLLKLLAQEPKRVADDIQKHITSCSPCYRTYSEFLQQMKTAGSH